MSLPGSPSSSQDLRLYRAESWGLAGQELFYSTFIALDSHSQLGTQVLHKCLLNEFSFSTNDLPGNLNFGWSPLPEAVMSEQVKKEPTKQWVGSEGMFIIWIQKQKHSWENTNTYTSAAHWVKLYLGGPWPTFGDKWPRGVGDTFFRRPGKQDPWPEMKLSISVLRYLLKIMTLYMSSPQPTPAPP